MQRKLRFLLEEMGKADIVNVESKNAALQQAIADARLLDKTHDLDELEVCEQPGHPHCTDSERFFFF